MTNIEAMAAVVVVLAGLVILAVVASSVLVVPRMGRAPDGRRAVPSRTHGGAGR